LKILTDDAESGVKVAQYYLGIVLANGQGITQDNVLAHMWYNLFAIQGHDNVRGLISSLEKKMSLQQIEQAQKMARDWKPSE
jgi:TPR repeat protein